MDDISTTLVSPPPRTDSDGKKRSNLAIMAENNDNVKRIKLESESTARQLEVAQNEGECTLCLASPKIVLFSPCNHLLCCGECAGKVAMCPVCRVNISKQRR